MEIEVRFGFLPISFKHKTAGNEDKGRNLKQAGHVLNLVERQREISAKVLRQTNINQPPYNVSILVDSNRNVNTAHCSCIAGISGYCKHISAVVIGVNEEKCDTKTSHPCQWKEPAVKDIRTNYSKGKKLADIFKKPKKGISFEAYKLKKEMVTFMTPSMLHCMLCAANPTFCWPLSMHNIAPVLPVMKILIEQQQTSELLKKLYFQDVPSMKQCCINTYNSKIPCDSLNVCTHTKEEKSLWQKERQFRITASRAYALFTYKENNWAEKCRKYFYPRSFKNKYTEHGIKFESVARQRYSRSLKKLGWWCARAVHGWPLLLMEFCLVEIEESDYWKLNVLLKVLQKLQNQLKITVHF